MGSEAKAEIHLVPKVEMSTLEPEIKTEVVSLVQAALSKIHPDYDSSTVKLTSGGISLLSAHELAETECNSYKDIIASLQAQLTASKQQAQDTYAELDAARNQLDIQRTKTRQLEQRILQLTKGEAHKASFDRISAERDDALAREHKATLAKDQLATENAQLSSQLTDAQNQLELKAAELNDATYKHKQLEGYASRMHKEISSWRARYPNDVSSVCSTMGPPAQPRQGGASQASGPQANMNPLIARRHTVPHLNIGPAASAATAVIESPQDINRPPKRARTDSNASSTNSDGDGTHSRLPSGGSASYALRPVKPEPIDTNVPRTAAPSTPTANSPRYPHSLSAQSYAPYPNAATYPYPQAGGSIQPIQLNYAPHAPQAPTQPTQPMQSIQPMQPMQPTQPMRSMQPMRPMQPYVYQPAPAPSVAPTHGAAPATPNMYCQAQTISPTPVSPVKATPTISRQTELMLNEMFKCLTNGYPDCKLCRAYPGFQNVPGPASWNSADLLPHVQMYHPHALTPAQAPPAAHQ